METILQEECEKNTYFPVIDPGVYYLTATSGRI